MRHANQYDGNSVVTHTIRAGESLSLIARRYKFRSWEPIWIFNTQIRRVLVSGDPNHIPEGMAIFIPRSEKGYDNLITKLKVLEVQMEGSLDQERYRLEGDWDNFQVTRAKFDLAGDIATSVASIALQARRAVLVARAAEKVIGREAVAAEYLARKETEKLHEMLTEKLVETELDYVLDKATEKLPDQTREGWKKSFDIAKSTRKSIKAIRNFSLQGGRFFLDVADILVDYCKVSKVADGWLWLVHRETPEDSYKSAEERIGRALANSKALLEHKIQYLKDEKDQLYNTRAAAGVAVKPTLP
jgi:hypothetical protein